MCFPSLLSYASRSSASWVNKKGAKSYAGHIASRYLAVNIVLEMKSLLYLLFLGAVVAATLAEEPLEDEAVTELLAEEDDETIAELPDEENDPRRPPRPSGRPPRPSRRPSKKLVRSPPLSPFLKRLLGCGELT